jgi:ribosome-associated protein
MNKNDTTKDAPEEVTEDAIEISKSQRKREANELLELGKQLIAMPEARLKRMPLDDDLRREIDFARSIRANGARKRQMMTVGKKLRQRDVFELVEAVQDIQNKDRKLNARHHHVEAWREALIDGSDQNLTYLLEKAPAINAQILRQLIRNARKEIKLSKPPTASRKLFKLLREADEGARLPALP